MFAIMIEVDYRMVETKSKIMITKKRIRVKLITLCYYNNIV